jgi:outer membrane receptor protein involved in Fe transport
LSLRLSPRVSLAFSVDNLLDASYLETQNLFESRLAPGAPAIARIHATPGYPRTITAGITLTR